MRQPHLLKLPGRSMLSSQICLILLMLSWSLWEKMGSIEGAHPGLIFVDNSTIKPATARHIAEVLGQQGVQCLDAPVSGGDIGARQGTLAIMVGGPTAALECSPSCFCCHR